jgi:hypothetical protein
VFRIVLGATNSWHSLEGSRDSDRLDGRDSFPGRDKRFFFTAHLPGRFWGPVSLLYNGYRGHQGREADHSLPSGAEVKNGEGTRLFSSIFPWLGA